MKNGVVVSLAAIVPSVVGRSESKLSVVERRGPPREDPQSVVSFVGACHGELDTVQNMLKQNPGLVNASRNRFGISANVGVARETFDSEIIVFDVQGTRDLRKVQ